MSSLTVHLFGPPRIELDDATLDLDHHKPMALLIYLLVTRSLHSREALAAFFWPDYRNARTYLRNNLSIIRHALGDGYEQWISIDRQTVTWQASGDAWIDVVEFEQHTAAFRGHNHPDASLCTTCVQHLAGAVALASDEFLVGFTLRDSPPFDEWSYFQSERLQADTAAALEALANHYGRSGSFESAIGYARRRLTLDKYHEPAHRQLMELYAHNGQQALALHQYEVCEQILGTELDAEPAQETLKLFEAIKGRRYPQGNLGQSSGTDPSAYRATNRIEGRQTNGTDLPPHNLPAPLKRLVGREQELEELGVLLADPVVRLITLTGPGGVGKTRLSVAVSGEALSGYADGVYFVSLAPLRSPDLLPLTIAQVVGIHVSPERPVTETLAIAIAARRMLLVLDNFEHLITAAPFVTELLQACPNLSILATSRERLNLTGEHIFVVAPLAVPSVNDATAYGTLVAGGAVQLFAQRAKQVNRHFVLNEDSAPLAAHICHRLDGLPLAIELAAARTNHLDLPTLAFQLNGYVDPLHEHGSALEVLADAKRDVPERHRSLRRAIGWSYDLLSAEEQALFRRLSVFVGGWSVEAAEAICLEGITLGFWEGMASLLDRHLIQRREGDSNGPCFSMLETLREFALERLRQSNEECAVRAGLAAYYVDRVEEWGAKSLGRRFADVYAVVQQEFPNILMVLDWALDQHDVEAGLRFCTALQMLWDDASTEVDQMLRRTLKLAKGSRPSANHASVLVSAGYFATVKGRYTEADTLFSQGLAMNEVLEEKMAPLFLSMAYGLTANCRFYRGQYEEANSYLWRGIAAVKQTGDTFSLAMNETDLGHKLTLCGQFDEAAILIEQALQRLRTTEQAMGIAKALADLGYLHILTGHESSAEIVLGESLALAEQNEQMGIVAGCKAHLALLALLQADDAGAATFIQDAIMLRRLHGRILRLIEAIEVVPQLALHTGRPEDALRLAGAMAAQRKTRDFVIAPIPGAELDRSNLEARGKLDVKAAPRYWEEGSTLTQDNATTLAIELCRSV